MSNRIYVGNLPMNIRTREVEDLFHKYGRIADIDLKLPLRPPAYAFVDFENSVDAEDAIEGRDGYKYEGQRLRVEPANPKNEKDKFPLNARGSGKYVVKVTKLPPRVSWQDLKDFMRKAGEVVFSKIDKKGDGIVEFKTRDEMKRAIRKLDDKKFRNRFGRNYVRVRALRKNHSRSFSRSASSSSRRSLSSEESSSKKSISRSRSRSRDKKRKRSPSRSYSRSSSPSPSSSRSRSPADRKRRRSSRGGKRASKSRSMDRRDKSHKKVKRHDKPARARSSSSAGSSDISAHKSERELESDKEHASKKDRDSSEKDQSADMKREDTETKATEE